MIQNQQLAQLNAELRALREECKRLQAIIDSRPAINAGLPETYIKWSQSIYAMELRWPGQTTQ